MPNTYTDDPPPTEVLSVSQPKIRANFNYLPNTLGTSLKRGDHQISLGGIDTNTFEGRHIQVSLKSQTSSFPLVGTLGDGVDSVIYSDAGNIFFSSSLNDGPYQLTNLTTNNPALNFAFFGANAVYPQTPVNTNIITSGGWTFLPGGLLLQYGSIQVTTNPGDSIIYSVNYPIQFPNLVYALYTSTSPVLVFSPSKYATAVIDSDAPKVTFAVNLNKYTITDICYWWAIGF